LAFVGVVGAQVVPTLVEYQAITKAVKKAANESSTVAEVRTSFEKTQNIEDIKAIGPKDLEVTKSGDKVVVNFAYNKEIHLGGPAYLLLKYAGSSAK
ncbi:MAG: DUF4845 domain-containing protein, partial [Brachymonas sp.]